MALLGPGASIPSRLDAAAVKPGTDLSICSHFGAITQPCLCDQGRSRPPEAGDANQLDSLGLRATSWKAELGKGVCLSVGIPFTCGGDALKALTSRNGKEVLVGLAGPAGEAQYSPSQCTPRS